MRATGSRTKKVLIVTPDIVGPVKNGGIGTGCYHYARSLAAAGVPVDVLFASFTLEAEALDHWKQVYAGWGIGFMAMNDVPENGRHVYGFRWYHERSWRIMNWLKEQSYTYVLFQDWHANGFWSFRAKQLGSGLSDVTLGVIAHSPTEWQNEGMKTFGGDVVYQSDLEWCERESIAAADILISPSAHMVEWLKSHHYSIPARIEICPYTFEDEVEAQPPETADTSHLIFFGRLETRKGLHLLGGALRALKAAGAALPARASFLGKSASVDGIRSEDYLQQLADDLPEVEFSVQTDLDYVEALSFIQTSRGVVVTPSLLDNLPLTVIESINNRLPFIAASTGGIPEMASPQVLFPPSIAGLKEKIRDIGSVDFAAVSHPYSREGAREVWLSHVRGVLAEVEEATPSKSRCGSDEVGPISVCIPFYRHDRYVLRLVRSFLNMHLPSLQLVIVDDGTPEGEAPILDQLAPQLRALGHIVHRQVNAGPGSARNKSLELAAHDLILFFDADNVPMPGMVQQLWRAMELTGADSIAAPFAAVPPMERAPTENEILYHFHPPGGSLALGLFDNMLGDMTALIRRKAINQVGAFSTTIGEPAWEDWELFLRLIGNDFRHFVYPEPLVYYTDHPNREKTPSRLYDVRQSLLSQLEKVDQPTLARLAQTLARHALDLRDRGVW